jgi:tripartite-type tricarboxylate transporter receptor subunit TctC
MPDLPAVAETLGLEGFEVVAWVAMFGPAGMPKDVVDKLNAAVRKALAKQEVKDKIAGFAAEVSPSTPDELAAFVKDQLASWGKSIKEAGIQPE